MGLFGTFTLTTILLAVLAAFFVYNSLEPRVPEIPDEYYGSGVQKKDDETVRPFKISVPDDVLEDLKTRLKNARVSHKFLEDSDNFYYGFNSRELLEFRDYWLNKYDWKKYEAILNEFPSFQTEIEGLKVHFIRATPPKTYKTVKPILISHGWPGNVFEFYKFIPILTDPKKHGIDVDFAFEVIAPSIPGYGWSEAPKKTGFSQLACARVFRKLMLRLGFRNFYLQGGDWGSLITRHIAVVYPKNVLGLHLNSMFITPGLDFATFLDVFGSFFPSLVFSSPNLRNHNFFEKHKTLLAETGYMHIQATKPDTVGSALNDSPLGLAAYIIEKFGTWTNSEYRALKDGGLSKKFTRDELLTIVMIYWVNGNIVSSQRFYREYFLDRRNDVLGRIYVKVPTAHASGLEEIYDRTPREISERFVNLTHHGEHQFGHFAAFEQPKILAESVFDFVKDLQ